MHKIKIGEYKNLNIEGAKQYEQTEIDKAVIQSILQSAENWAKDNRGIGHGDQVVLRMEATCDGLLVPQMCNSKLSLTMGDPSVVEQFNVLKGKKRGDNFEMKIYFNESAPIDQIKAKTVDFSGTILDVTFMSKTPIDDEFAHIFDPNCHTVADLRKKFEDVILRNLHDQYKEQNYTKIMEKIIATSEIEFNQEVLETTVNMVVEQSKQMMMGSNLPNMEQVMQGLQEDDSFMKDCREITIKSMSEETIVNEISRLENIIITDEEFIENKAFFTVDAAGTDEYNRYFPNDLGFKEVLLKEKVTDALIDWNIKIN